MIDRSGARDWLADHLPALVWCALVLWLPPVGFAIGVDLRLLQAPGTGYPALSDPSLMLAVLQLTLMMLSLPGMIGRRRHSWQWLFIAWLVWCVHAAWGIFVRVRLNGGVEWLAMETLLALTGVAIAAGVMVVVRPAFTAGGPPFTLRPTRWRPRAGLSPGMK